MNFKNLLFGTEYKNHKIYDQGLKLFDNSKYLTFDQLAKGINPKHYTKVVNFLIDKKLAERIGYGLRLTAKGEDISEAGGLASKIVCKWFNCLGIAIGVIAAIVTILIAVLGVL